MKRPDFTTDVVLPTVGMCVVCTMIGVIVPDWLCVFISAGLLISAGSLAVFAINSRNWQQGR